MSAELGEIAELIKVVQLRSVRLVEGSVKTKIRSPNDVGDEIDCYVRTDAKVDRPSKGSSSFYVLATIDLRLVPKSQEQQHKLPAVSITAGFELEYALPEDFDANKKQLDAFASTNAVFNAWPYWREFVQSATTRMNLPPITLPLFRLGDAKLKGKLVDKTDSKKERH